MNPHRLLNEVGANYSAYRTRNFVGVLIRHLIERNKYASWTLLLGLWAPACTCTYFVFYIVPCTCMLQIWLRHHVILSIESSKCMTCKRNDLIVRTECRNTYGVEYLNSFMYRGLNASGFTVEGPWQTRSIVSVEVVCKLVDAGSC